VVGREAVRLENDEIFQLLILVGDVSPQQVGHDRLALARHLVPHDMALAGVELRLNLLGGEVSAMAVIPRWQAALLQILTHLLEALRRAEAAVGVAAFDQPLRRLSVVMPALALNVGSVGTADVGPLVPLEPEP